jgi:hypothetical protein
VARSGATVLGQTSWRIIRSQPRLIALAAIGLVAPLLLVGGAVTTFALYGFEKRHLLIAFAVVVYPYTVVSTFLEVSFVAGARQALAGENVSILHALAQARSRLRLILLWSALAATVALAIQALESIRGGALLYRVVARFLEMAWAAATYLAIPVLVFEDLGPVATVRRSAGLVRQRWGTGLKGVIGIGIISAFVYIPLILLVALGVVMLRHDHPVSGAIVAVASGIGLAVAIAIGSAVASLFRVVLYVYGAEGATAPGFDEQQLAQAFARKA